MPTNRIVVLDAAKGLGILFVYVGHLLIYGSPAFAYVFSFHMPLFFIISGVLSRTTFDKFKDQANKIFSDLGIPLIVFNIIGLLCFAIRAECPFPISFAYEEWSRFYCVTIHEGNIGWISAWFLVCLAGTKLVFWRIRNSKWVWFILIASFFAGNEMGLLNVKILVGAPLMLFSIPTALFFFGLGNIFRDAILEFVAQPRAHRSSPPQHTSNLGERFQTLMIAIVFFVVVGLCQTGETPNIASVTHVNPAFFLCAALGGSFAVICLARSCICKPLCFIGQHSLCFFTLEGHARYFVLQGLQQLHVLSTVEPMKTELKWPMLILTTVLTLLLVSIVVPGVEKLLKFARNAWNLKIVRR